MPQPAGVFRIAASKWPKLFFVVKLTSACEIMRV